MSNVKTRDLTRGDRPAELEGNIRDLPRRQSGAPRRPDDASEQTTTLIRRFAHESTREIDRLIDDLQKLRQKLEFESNRVQRDIADYVSLSHSVVQLTQIVSDSMVHVRKFPDAPATGMDGRNAVILTAIEQELSRPHELAAPGAAEPS
jgi:hypothetical protein